MRNNKLLHSSIPKKSTALSCDPKLFETHPTVKLRLAVMDSKKKPGAKLCITLEEQFELELSKDVEPIWKWIGRQLLPKAGYSYAEDYFKASAELLLKYFDKILEMHKDAKNPTQRNEYLAFLKELISEVGKCAQLRTQDQLMKKLILKIQVT